MDLRDKSVSERRKTLEEHLGIELPAIGIFSQDEKTASERNCENMIGTVSIPLGIAGPLKIKSQLLKKDFLLPLATTEGALVASVNRGCKALNLENGTTVTSTKIGVTRAPVFEVAGLAEGEKFIDWVEKNSNKLKEVTEKTSSHLSLLEIKPWQVGRNVFLRFRFDSEDAMGMNMATIAVAKAVELIKGELGIRCIALSGNMCVDKKASFLNFIEGRGISVRAEGILSEETVSTVLKTSINDILEVWKRKISVGSLMAGTLGANAHMANVLAAIFLATGQDLGHIVECANGVTTLEKMNDKLYISIYLPDLMIGTVGGGTGLSTQKEALSILGISGGDKGKNSQKLAEIMGGAVLAGELSLLASLAKNTLAAAHQKLARGK